MSEAGEFFEEPRLPFERIGPYELCRLIGQGATGAVYEGRHVTSRCPAAVKVMHAHLARDAIAAARFVREAKVLSRLSHPNIVDVLDVGTQGGTPYLAMSLVDGDDLAEHFRRRHPMSLRRVVQYLSPVLDAVAKAHDAGVVHRDLKPTNIRLMRRGASGLEPKVLDFGMAKLTGGDSLEELTETGDAVGTVTYMAPEQLRSAKGVDARCDVYALGVVLYQCATGQLPFYGESAYDLMHAVLTEDVAPPSSVRADLPTAFDAIVLRAMHRDAAERPTVRELRAALAPFASAQPSGRPHPLTIGSAERPRRATTSPQRTARRHSRPPTVGLFGFQIIEIGDLDVDIWLAGTEDFPAKEWTSACIAIAESIRARSGDASHQRTFIVTDGAAPNATQRKEWSSGALGGYPVKTAVLTSAVETSPVKRGIATALTWLNPQFRVFPPSDASAALDHLDVPRQHFDVIRDTLSVMQARLPPVRTLSVIARQFGVS